MTSNISMIKKLQRAINDKYEQRITYNTSQFFLNQTNKQATRYTVKKAVTNSNTGKNQHIEIFSTFSQLQVVLFLRDYWYYLEGTEIPTDNEIWEDIKRQKEINYKEIVELC